MVATYLLKSIPEDFLVTELLTPTFKENGKFIYCRLWKRNVEMLTAILQIAKALGIPQHFIGTAGNKDKQAITSQIISIPARCEERLKSLLIPNIELTVLGKGNEPIYLGRNDGNEFTIVARKIQQPPKHVTRVLNYFGPQRFGTSTATIGKLIITGNMKEAVSLLSQERGAAGPQLKQLQEKLSHDPAAQLRSLPKKLLKLYVHSYQSLIWNTWLFCLQEQHQLPATTLTLPGFGITADTILQQILDEEYRLWLHSGYRSHVPQSGFPNHHKLGMARKH